MALLEEPVRGVKIVKNYIDGEWVDSKGEMVDVVNPATMQTIAKCPISTKEEIDEAVAAARAAYPDWRRTTPLARSRILFRLKELLEQNFEEVSRIQTQEHGKCIDESRGETRRGIENVEVACGIPTMMQGYFSEDIAHVSTHCCVADRQFGRNLLISVTLGDQAQDLDFSAGQGVGRRWLCHWLR